MSKYNLSFIHYESREDWQIKAAKRNLKIAVIFLTAVIIALITVSIIAVIIILFAIWVMPVLIITFKRISLDVKILIICIILTWLGLGFTAAFIHNL